MNTLIPHSAIIIENEFLEDGTTLMIDEKEKLTTEIIIPGKRFGIVDLWNIRKKGRFLSMYS